jgi:hypothetical protein
MNYITQSIEKIKSIYKYYMNNILLTSVYLIITGNVLILLYYILVKFDIFSFQLWILGLVLLILVILVLTFTNNRNTFIAILLGLICLITVIPSIGMITLGIYVPKYKPFMKCGDSLYIGGVNIGLTEGTQYIMQQKLSGLYYEKHYISADKLAECNN